MSSPTPIASRLSGGSQPGSSEARPTKSPSRRRSTGTARCSYGRVRDSPSRLLTDQELSAAPPPASILARSPEAVADTLADGFVRRDADLLGTVMAGCMAAALEQAGGTFTPHVAFLEDLRKAFAGGLTVTVQRRPIESDATGTFLRATWNAAVEQRRDLYLRRDGEVWSWYLTLTRQPVR